MLNSNQSKRIQDGRPEKQYPSNEAAVPEQTSSTNIYFSHHKIAVMVPNAATRDPRVMKWARTLRRAGEDVCLLGLWEKNYPTLAVLLDDGFPVYRVRWYARSQFHLAMRSVVFSFILFGLMSAIIALLAGVMLESLSPVFSWAFQAAERLSGALPRAVEHAASFVSVHVWFAAISAMALLIMLIPFLFLRNLRSALGSVFLFSIFLPIRVLSFPLRKLRAFAVSTTDKIRKLKEREGAFGNAALEKVEAALSPLATGSIFNFLQMRLLPLPQKLVAKIRTEAFYKALCEIRPEIIVANEVLSLPAALAYKKKYGCKIIYDAHEIYDDLAHGTASSMKFYKSVHTRAFKSIDAMSVVSSEMQKYYERAYEHTPEISVVANATEKVAAARYDGRLHEAAKLPPEQKILLYQGGFSLNRHIEDVIEAAFYLPPEWSVVLMGWGSAEQEFRDRVKHLTDEWLARIRRSKLSRIDREEGDAIDKTCADILGSQSDEAQLFRLVTYTTKLNALFSGVAHDSASATGGTEFYGDSVQYRTALPPSVIDMQSAKSMLGSLDNMMFDKDEFLDRLHDHLEIADSMDEVFRSLYGKSFTRLRNNLIEKRLSVQMMDVQRSFNRVRIIEPAPAHELPLWTSGATIGIIPYKPETLNGWVMAPNKLWEFPNAGVPLLAHGAPTIFEKIKKYQFGWVLPTDASPRVIANLVAGISEQELESKRERCRRFIDEDGWHAYEPTILSMIQRLRCTS